MKTIGLIGGMSWESTVAYYRLLNEEVKHRLGGHHSARIVLVSLDFEEIKRLQHLDCWEELAEIMVEAAQRLQHAGADFIVICTNTMHKLVRQMQDHVRIPILHIADAAACRIKKRGIGTVGLLGTRFTMEQDFYKGRLRDIHGLEVIVPQEQDREIVHRIIYDELCSGIATPESKAEFGRIMDRLTEQGAQGLILGCTEISLLVGQEDARVPIFDTTRIHALEAVNQALAPTQNP